MFKLKCTRKGCQNIVERTFFIKDASCFECKRKEGRIASLKRQREIRKNKK